MALINKENKYIKLNNGGLYDIYMSKEERDKYKNATNPITILEKYKEILDAKYQIMYDEAIKLKITEEDYADAMKYDEILNSNPDYKSIVLDYNNWLIEENLFRVNLYTRKDPNCSFPLMQTIFEDVKDAIPDVIESGQIGIYRYVENIEDMYRIVKLDKVFGETEDC